MLVDQDFPMLASAYFAKVLNEGQDDPTKVEAVQGLLRVIELVGDDTLIPTLLEQAYGRYMVSLSVAELSAVNFYVGLRGFRTGHGSALDHLESIPFGRSPYYGRARLVIAGLREQAIWQSGDAAQNTSPDWIQALERLETQTQDRGPAGHARLVRTWSAYAAGDLKRAQSLIEPLTAKGPPLAILTAAWIAFLQERTDAALDLAGRIELSAPPLIWLEAQILAAIALHLRCQPEAQAELVTRLEAPVQNLRQRIAQEQERKERPPSTSENELNLGRRVRLFRQILARVEAELSRARALPAGPFRGDAISVLTGFQDTWSRQLSKLVWHELTRWQAQLDALEETRAELSERAKRGKKGCAGLSRVPGVRANFLPEILQVANGDY
jgi:hypothetical protein